MQSKLDLLYILKDLKSKGNTIYGISAPSRSSTLISYTGIDHKIMNCILEIKGSHKIGKYMPGTLIPVLDEKKLYEDQPEYVLILAWHIADNLIKNIKT